LHRSFGAKTTPEDDKGVILGGALALDTLERRQKSKNRALTGAV